MVVVVMVVVVVVAAAAVVVIVVVLSWLIFKGHLTARQQNTNGKKQH